MHFYTIHGKLIIILIFKKQMAKKDGIHSSKRGA
jgi:hypothetical protein